MGWAVTDPTRDSALLPDDGEEKRFYYVHKYRVVCDRRRGCAGDRALWSNASLSAIQRGNIYGVQFHPEKSHRFGKELLGRFGQLPC